MTLINFSGLASGIDSTALIEATLERDRLARIVPYENEITERESTNEALNELKTLLSELSTTVQPFRELNGGVLAKTLTSSDETALTGVASNSAENGTYEITVAQLAKNATFSFGDRFTSEDDAINGAINDADPAIDRTVSFTIGSGASPESVDIELTSSTTASQFVSEFNSQSDQATASLVNTGTSSAPSYAIIIQSKNEGTDEGTITLDSVGTSVGALGTNTLDQARDLEFSLSGVSGTITRSSNTVNDVLDGVSFTAIDTGFASLSVSTDTTSTEGFVQDFVDKYNEIVEFIAENDSVLQEEINGETTNIFGALATTSLDDSILTALRGELTSSGITGSSVNILADLGITTERDGTLAFDSDVFQTAVTDAPESVESILQNLGESLGAVQGTIAQYTQFNGLIDEAIQGNDTRIDSLQDKIFNLEENLTSKEQSLVQQFARLEAQISNLQSQQSALISALPQG